MKRFKEALGLSDEDAAIAHIDVARRLYRLGFETKSAQEKFEQRLVGWVQPWLTQTPRLLPQVTVGSWPAAVAAGLKLRQGPP